MFTPDDIDKILPQKPPFRFVSRVASVNMDKIVAYYDIPSDETFPGHFPDNPIMPGVLQLESVFQTGILLMYYRLKQTLTEETNIEDYITLLTKVEKIRFKKIIRPPETLQIEVEFLEQQDFIFHLKGTIKDKDGKKVCLLKYTGILVDKEQARAHGQEV